MSGPHREEWDDSGKLGACALAPLQNSQFSTVLPGESARCPKIGYDSLPRAIRPLFYATMQEGVKGNEWMNYVYGCRRRQVRGYNILVGRLAPQIKHNRQGFCDKAALHVLLSPRSVIPRSDGHAAHSQDRWHVSIIGESSTAPPPAQTPPRKSQVPHVCLPFCVSARDSHHTEQSHCRQHPGSGGGSINALYRAI